MKEVEFDGWDRSILNDLSLVEADSQHVVYEIKLTPKLCNMNGKCAYIYKCLWQNVNTDM